MPHGGGDNRVHIVKYPAAKKIVDKLKIGVYIIHIPAAGAAATVPQIYQGKREKNS